MCAGSHQLDVAVEVIGPVKRWLASDGAYVVAPATYVGEQAEEPAEHPGHEVVVEHRGLLQGSHEGHLERRCQPLPFAGVERCSILPNAEHKVEPDVEADGVPGEAHGLDGTLGPGSWAATVKARYVGVNVRLGDAVKGTRACAFACSQRTSESRSL